LSADKHFVKRPADLEVSVVTPCLNPGSWLERCLDSVSAQTYPHIEHIVIDGGSTDGTVELLRRHGVRFVSEPDSGQANAINKGFKLASGAFVGWLNADDVLTPGAIEATVATLRANPSVGWTYGEVELRRNGERDYAFRPPAQLTPRSFDISSVIPQPGSFVARWALERVGDLDESLHLAMDYDLWLRLIDAGIPSARVPAVVATFEIHGSSKTGVAGRSGFLREESLALLKSGRQRQAAFALGRALALGAVRDGTIDDVEKLLSDAREAYPHLDARAVEAGARSEATVLAVRRSALGLRHLLAPSLWRYPESRRRLSEAARWGLRVWTRRARNVYP
jgi:Glycosyl transferase family 2